MKRLLLAAAFCAAATPTLAQLLPISQPLQQRSLPAGVSIPAVTSSSVSYPGCPGEVTSHPHTWYFDQALGQTQSGGGLGTLAAPWKDLQALTGNNAGTPMAGYTQVLLSTAPGGTGPVGPGDLIILNTGSYGALQLGASPAIVNNPAITIQAGAGQTPLFTTVAISEFTGIHLNGWKIRSISGGPIIGLLVATDNGVPHSAYDTIFENMDVSSTDVATGDGLSLATWIADMRPGIVFQSSGGDNIPSLAWSCASAVNNHVYEVSYNGQFGAIEGEVSSLFVQGNEIDHYYSIGVAFDMSNVAIGQNYFHDMVQTGQGQQIYGVYPNIDSSADASKHQSNVYLYKNKHIESVDPAQTLGPAPSSFYLNSTSDITNFVAVDNLVAAGNECGICPGNAHNYVIAHNSLMVDSGGVQSPEFNLGQAHAGAAGYGTGPIGVAPSNGWAFDNIGPLFSNPNGNVIQTYYNIAAPGSTGFSNWTYFNNWATLFASPTPGSVITLPAATGQQNLDDGVGTNPQTNEFTTVACTATAFPCSPQPNWTPLPGSPAATAGGVQSPLLTDYNGVPFTPPYSIGALAAFAGYDTTAAIDCEFKLNQCWDATVGNLVAPSTLLTDTRSVAAPYDPGTSITTSIPINTLPIGSAGLQVFQNNVNYLKSTNGDYSATGSWTPAHSGAVAPTITKNPNFGGAGCTAADTAPDGSCNTTELTFPAMAASQESVVQQQSATLTVGATYTFWIWLKNSAATSNPQTYIDILQGSGSFLEIAQQIVQPGPTWKRFAVTFVMPVGFTTVYPEIGGTTPVTLSSNQGQVGGGTLEAWVSGLTLGSAPGPYVPTTTTAATTIALDNIAATGHLATALASSNAAVAVTTQMAGNGLAGTMLDGNGTVLLGKDATDHVTTALGSVLASKAQGNFSGVENAYLAWNGSGGSINLGGTAVVTDATARTPAATFHVGTTSGTTAPLNGYITSLKVYPTALAPPLVASAPLTGVTMTTPITLASGTLQSGAPSTYVEGDTWMTTKDASGNIFALSNDSGWGSFAASGGNGNVILSQPSWTAGTPGYYNFANIGGGPPGVVNSFSTALGTFSTQQTATQNTWKSCGLIAIKDGANTDLFAGLVWQQNPAAAPWNFGQASSTIISATTANATTSGLWNGMPATPPVLPAASPTFNSVNFGAPCFVQYADGYVNSGLPIPNPDNSGSYLYAISNDLAINLGSHIYLARIPLATIETSLGGSLAAASTAANWQFYNSAGCIGGDGTNGACWGVLASATPIFTLANKLGRSAMTYLPATNRYVITTWNFPLGYGPTSGTATETQVATTSQLEAIDCAHPWSCTGVVSTIDIPTLGQYSLSVVPSSLSVDGGYTATGLLNGNFMNNSRFNATTVYGPTMTGLNFRY